MLLFKLADYDKLRLGGGQVLFLNFHICVDLALTSKAVIAGIGLMPIEMNKMNSPRA